MNIIIDIICIAALVAVAAFFGWSARKCADENKIRRVIARIKKRVDDRMADNLAAEERCKTAHFGAAAKEDLDILSILDGFEAERGRDECIVIEPFKDGDAWCYLLGRDLQRGIVGFGGSPADAKKEFFADLALALDKIEAYSQGINRSIERTLSLEFKMGATFHKSRRIGVDYAWIDFDDREASKAIASGMFNDGERIIVQIRKA